LRRHAGVDTELLSIFPIVVGRITFASHALLLVLHAQGYGAAKGRARNCCLVSPNLTEVQR
jgi:hypothetical protein